MVVPRRVVKGEWTRSETWEDALMQSAVEEADLNISSILRVNHVSSCKWKALGDLMGKGERKLTNIVRALSGSRPAQRPRYLPCVRTSRPWPPGRCDACIGTSAPAALDLRPCPLAGRRLLRRCSLLPPRAQWWRSQTQRQPGGRPGRCSSRSGCASWSAGRRRAGVDRRAKPRVCCAGRHSRVCRAARASQAKSWEWEGSGRRAASWYWPRGSQCPAQERECRWKRGLYYCCHWWRRPWLRRCAELSV